MILKKFIYKSTIILALCTTLMFIFVRTKNGIVTRKRIPQKVDFMEMVMSYMQIQSDSYLLPVQQTIIFKQNLKNYLDFGKSGYFFPIPIENRTLSVIFSSWRSGSTFLGDIISSVPATYYHYEPLNFLGLQQFEYDENLVRYLQLLLRCNFRNGKALINMRIENLWKYNQPLNFYCKELDTLCRSISFREAFCNIFPRQTMKLVMARITMAEPLLCDTELNVRVVLLVRDPRAVYFSRQGLNHCNSHPDCYSMENYCKFLFDDYNNAKLLLKRFPETLKVLRFEDIAKNPFSTAPEILSFFQLPYGKKVDEFLATHTNETKGGTFSTFRDTKHVLSKWMKNLNMSTIYEIQTVCENAMKVWGYVPITDEGQLNEPVYNLAADFVI